MCTTYSWRNVTKFSFFKYFRESRFDENQNFTSFIQNIVSFYNIHRGFIKKRLWLDFQQLNRFSHFPKKSRKNLCVKRYLQITLYPSSHAPRHINAFNYSLPDSQSQSVDEILWCNHSNETSSTILSQGTTYI